MDDIIIKKLVNLRFMHFPDKTIDCKFAGRPYLIYKIDDKYSYLLKLSSKKSNKGLNYYYELLPDSSNKLDKKSYVDLKYFIVYEIEKLKRVLLTQKLEYGLREYGIITDEQLDEILSQINMLYVSNLQF